MNFQGRYEIQPQVNMDARSSLTIRITLYDRSLKSAIRDFVERENLQIRRTTFADGYIDYEITSSQELNFDRLEQLLGSFVQM